jgi:[ribosomal protein S5]-alanine N-acetyltransferase
MLIQTERLVLRDYAHEDWPSVLAYQSDSRYLRYYPWTERDEAAVKEFVARFISWQTQDPRDMFQFAITLPEEGGRLVGSCGVRVNDCPRREGNIGYELNPEYWGRGYATEAARAMLRYGFDSLGLHRVWAECNADNTASAHVLEKLGMRREAHFLERDYFKDRWWGSLIFAIDWAASGIRLARSRAGSRVAGSHVTRLRAASSLATGRLADGQIVRTERRRATIATGPAETGASGVKGQSRGQAADVSRSLAPGRAQQRSAQSGPPSTDRFTRKSAWGSTARGASVRAYWQFRSMSRRDMPHRGVTRATAARNAQTWSAKEQAADQYEQNDSVSRSHPVQVWPPRAICVAIHARHRTRPQPADMPRRVLEVDGAKREKPWVVAGPQGL